MPLFMDRHELGDANPEAVAEAHTKDLDVQAKHNVRFLTYWFDEPAQRVFCLADAPNKEAVATVHREAHGLIPNDVIEVNQGLVQDFLGKIENTAASEDNFQPNDPPEETAFRVILFTDMESSTANTQRLGDAGAMALLRTHNGVVRDALQRHDGSEVKHTGDGIMASFASASRSVECAITIQRGLFAHNEQGPETPVNVRIGITAGEPVAESEDLFGAAVQLASRICDCAEAGEILVANVLRELCIGKNFPFADRGQENFRGFDDPMQVWEVRWQDVG